MHASPGASAPAFFGSTVVRTAFVIAVLGWGIGFYGPPIFLHAVVSRTGWSLSLVSTAVTLHFLLGACVVAALPRIHQRLGIPVATSAGVLVLAVGVMGWAAAAQPWQLFIAALLTGAGWAPLGAAGINAMIAPWFVRHRPMALAKAYNGASIGGAIFSPLWVALIQRLGLLAASAVVGAVSIAVVLPLARVVLSKTPAGMGQAADGDAPGAAGARVEVASPAPTASLWQSRAFITLMAAMALGLFAQIGLVAHLFSLMAPGMGAQVASGVMALATACGMGGRLVMARLLGPGADLRRAASASYAVQAIGTAILLVATPHQTLLIVLGTALFGLGIGNATSLPPLIAQAEFAKSDVARVVARCVAFSQAMYAFAPAAFAMLLDRGVEGTQAIGTGTQSFFSTVLLIQGLAIASMLAGRRPACCAQAVT